MKHLEFKTIRHLITISAMLCLLILSAPAHTGPSEDAVRQVGVLIAKEKWAEALAVARDAPVRESTRATLIGVIAMRAGAHKKAIESFNRALKLGPPREQIHLYLAWSHYALKQRKQARQSLSKVKSKRAQVPFYWLLRGRMARDTNDAEGAYKLLLQGTKRYPEDRDLARELGFVMVAAGAHQQARRILIRALSDPGPDTQVWADGTRLLRALSDRGDFREALFYTEILRARLPRWATQIDVLAAHLYARTKKPMTAAQLFARASLRGGPKSYAFEAADQFRVARQTRRALQWNARVQQPKQRLRQRMLILTEAGQWNRAAATGRKLDTLGGLDTALLRQRYGMALLFGPLNLDEARRVRSKMGDGPEANSLAELIKRCQRERCR